jgi:uncharacterized protein YggL (DUF469 family)
VEGEGEVKSLKQPFKTRPYEEVAKECGLRNKSLKQQLQDLVDEIQENKYEYISCDASWEGSAVGYIDDSQKEKLKQRIRRFLREWLEQKRQEINDEPVTLAYHGRLKVIDELLEELKE